MRVDLAMRPYFIPFHKPHSVGNKFRYIDEAIGWGQIPGDREYHKM